MLALACFYSVHLVLLLYTAFVSSVGDKLGGIGYQADSSRQLFAEKGCFDLDLDRSRIALLPGQVDRILCSSCFASLYGIRVFRGRQTRGIGYLPNPHILLLLCCRRWKRHMSENTERNERGHKWKQGTNGNKARSQSLQERSNNKGSSNDDSRKFENAALSAWD
jgi:hypothetical protein